MEAYLTLILAHKVPQNKNRLLFRSSHALFAHIIILTKYFGDIDFFLQRYEQNSYFAHLIYSYFCSFRAPTLAAHRTPQNKTQVTGQNRGCSVSIWEGLK